ncbi:MAG: 3-keto-disaccharide hydrolase [Paludibacter sp.]
MKTQKIAIILSFFCIFSVTGQSEKKCTKHQSFFSEQDTKNWEYVMKDKNLIANQMFVMKDGILQITGLSSGYLRTKKSYSNYELNLEWRWIKTFGNSGVLVHIQPKDTIWPICYQVQQKVDAAGDIICMNGLWAKECSDSVKFTVKKTMPSNEKPLGEWNTMQILCKNNTLKVYINGIIQNQISGLTAKKGFIGFQNEGVPLEFRKLTIK